MEAIRLDQVSPRVMAGTPHPFYLWLINKKHYTRNKTYQKYK